MRLLLALAIVSLVPPAGRDRLQPPPILDSEIFVAVTPVGTMPGSAASAPLTNATSPLVVGGELLLVDQRGFVYRRDAGGTFHTLLSPATAPPGLSLFGESILNVAANAAGDDLLVIFTSSTAPVGIPVAASPRSNHNAFQVVYRYDYDGRALSQPLPVVAFESYAFGHTGGGASVADDGSLLLAIGDNGDAGEDGGPHPQDAVSHLGKIVRIDVTGAWSIVARGVRNVQRLEVVDGRVVFTDIGGAVAEELNAVTVAALLDAGTIENFGWGRHADGRAREGTFYIDASGNAAGEAPPGEPGFVQPLAQWGREGRTFVAVTGPVSRAASTPTIESLFGDLVSGSVYALRADLVGRAEEVFAVHLVDAGLLPTTLASLARGRPDPRFFRFADGAAGVLLERTGALYRLDQLPCGKAGYDTVGAACGPESLGVDALARLGGPAAVRIDGGLPGERGVFLIGFDQCAPPKDLSPLGMPGCALHLRPILTLDRGMFDATGVVRAALSIPNRIELCGLCMLVQGVATRPGATPLGLTVTELLRLRVGL